MKALALFLVLYGVPNGVAQGHFSVHGHWVGEASEAVLSEEPEVAHGLAQCHAIAANPDVWVLNDPAYIPGPHASRSPDPNPAEAALLKAQDDLYKAILDRILSSHSCPALTRAFDSKGKAVVTAPGTREGGPVVKWMFDGGAITQMWISFQGSTYNEVVSDVTQRCGVVPVESTEAMHNGFGSAWEDRSADWIAPDIYAYLRQSNDPTAPSLVLIVDSRADYDRMKAEQANRPKPLD